MNCDQAFEAMTDRQRREGRELRHHLASCPRCRQMRETLEPALGRLAASAVASPPRSDSRETGPASPSAVSMARRVAARLSQDQDAPDVRQPARRRRPHVSRVWSYLASAACGALIALGAIVLLQNSAARPALASECLWQNRGQAPLRAESSAAVVLSCVGCHMSSSISPQPDEWRGERLPLPPNGPADDETDSAPVHGA